MYRTAFARQVRLFSTSPIIRNKGPIDSAKDALKSVDRTVSDQLVKGIETGGTSLISIPNSIAQRISIALLYTLSPQPQPQQSSQPKSTTLAPRPWP